MFILYVITSLFSPNHPRTIISSNEAVAVLRLQLPLHVLLRLLHGDVHKTIQASQDAFILHNSTSA